MAETTFTEAQTKQLTEALGLPETADAATILLTVEDLVTTPAAPTAEQIKASGAIAIDPGTLTQLKADAERGRTLQVAASRRTATDAVDAALQKGKIPPSRRDHWLTLIEADPQMGKVLASMPNELAVPMTEIGYSKGAEDDIVEAVAWFR